LAPEDEEKSPEARRKTTPKARSPAVDQPPVVVSSAGWIKSIASDYKAVASLIGLLVYGVVRVSYDAYYTRLGVFPEAVGLTEATILGRAVLYLALTASLAAILGGLWFTAVRFGLPRFSALGPSRLAAAILVPTLVATALLAAAGQVRHLLWTRDFAYYCFQRCKFQPLDESTLSTLKGIATRNEAGHPGWHVTELGPAWLVALPLVAICVAAALAFLFRRTDETLTRRAAIGMFASLAIASLGIAALAPHMDSTLSNAASQDSSSWLLDHQTLLWWTVFALFLVAIGGGLLAVGSRLGWHDSSASPGTIASLIVVLPLLLGFLEPNIPRFIEEEGARAVLTAALLWAVLLAGCFMIWPLLVERRLSLTPTVALFVALVVTLTLFLAWERGLNLAKQAAMGDQIYPQRFSMLSVRANVVCLEEDGKAPVLLRPRPYTYLGQANGTIILYDYKADLEHDTPTSFPVRFPAGGAVVRLAKYDAGTWNCGPN
jgi:hypothetical protein